MAREGIPFVLVPAAAAALCFYLGYWQIASGFALLTAFNAFFFRDPDRQTPADPALVVSPADGRVTKVGRVVEDDSESATLVSIFLSPFDVHINRAPISGRVTNVTYRRGRFVMATRDDASLINEQNIITIEGREVTLACKQIAGIVARRVVCWKKSGDVLEKGERIGLIKFSSRTDLILPANVRVSVKPGDRVRGAESVIGRIE